MPKTDESHNDDQDEELDEGAVETGDETLEDESSDESEEDDSEEEDDDQDEDDSEESDDDEEESEFKKAFSQIKGDNLEEYTPNLEEAYRKSSREGIRLAKEAKEKQAQLDAIMAVVDKNPELKKAIEAGAGKEVLVDPALTHARQQMEQQMEKDYAKFAQTHPSIDDDPDIAEKVLEEVAILGESYRKRGKNLSMEKALKLAWSNLDLDEDEKDEKIANAAKKQASKSKNNSSNRKKGKKTNLTPEQIATGKKMGLTEKDLLATL